MEFSFSLLSRNTEHQDFLSFNALSIIVLLNFFQIYFCILSVFAYMCIMFVDHVCTTYAYCVCVLCVPCVCVHVFVLCMFGPSGDQKRTEIQSFVNHNGN